MRLLVAKPKGPLEGEVLIPPSKYHAHRALMLAALADGESTIRARTDARHVGFTVQALRGLGADIAAVGHGWRVRGEAGFSPKAAEVSVGSSGTTLYFLLGLAALGDRPVTITGQRYFKRRPIGPLLRALQRLGVKVDYEHQSLPVTVHPGRPRGGHIHIDGTLSQWISGLLMLAPFAEGPTTIEVSGDLNERGFLELTVDMMREFGLQVDVREDWRRFDIEPQGRPRARDIVLPPDIGSAAFGLAACALHPSKVTFRSLVPIHGHPEAPGAGGAAGRRRADAVRRRRPVDLHRPRRHAAGRRPAGLPRPPGHGADPLDAGQPGRGRTVLSHVAHVRLKESDRVASMLQLRKMGARVEFDGNDMEFEGVDRLHGAELSSFNDHRVLMALTVAGSTADGVTELSYPHAYRISYPEFLDHMNAIGIPAAVTPRVPTSVQA